MKKDINIPEIKDVFMAVVKEYNDEFQCEDWNIYLVNDKEEDLEMAIIVSKGYDEDKMIETSVMRKTINKLPAKSFAKVELIQPDLFKLTNFFNTTFFIGNTMYDKKYVFEKNTIKEGALRVIKQLNKEGIIAK
ncbi:hypothetical protein [Wenyingzhuangia marina]|uniref:Phenylalanyl-tRNA synthetase subunit alpha n=1 Tax=Wenyingzhuangia marina TaxID=1195760 RepID=A0A1M5SJY5_9FLAO|nr:hypothetical protein [Wenyingzhuangia marina]GGF62651.1 hypothetical protein GCM10011397_02150 [Wenyingzhuangia marina]SHH38856.1 hypothetical protein SAMN05444281_0355 [Wenyingzhuangia marina]